LVKNHFGIFNKLANHPNINIKVTDVNGLSILHYGVHLGRADVIKLAIDKGIDINLSDALGRTSVYWCSLLGNVEMLQFLQQQGADINIQNKAGYHPIYGAVHNNQLCTVETLLKHDKFLVNQPAEENATPLYYSLGYGGQEINIEIIKLLLKHEADVKIAMNDGDTPMHMAHYKSSKEAIELLLENGANLHAQNNDKKTPLHCMLESKTSSQDLKMQVIEAYKQKYDFSIQDKDGKTPIDYAKEYCPTIFSNIGLDINSVTEEDILANLLQNTILTTGNNDDPQNLEAELTGNNIIEENNNTMLD
jgi:ankyrin repeat protein